MTSLTTSRCQRSGIIRRATAPTSATSLDGSEVVIAPGDLVWISMTDVNTNPEIWENPDQIDVLRKAELYNDSTITLQNDSVARTSNIAQPIMLREVRSVYYALMCCVVSCSFLL